MENKKPKNKKLKKNALELRVYLSYKVKNGSIKVSEKDLKKLGMGVVEDIIITPVGKKDGLAGMLFSDAKIKAGNVILSVADAQGLDVEEGDLVTVKKAVVAAVPLSKVKSDPKSSVVPAKKPVPTPAKKPVPTPAKKPVPTPAKKPVPTPAKKPVPTPAKKPVPVKKDKLKKDSKLNKN
jgi:hypothetical protein